MDKLYTIQEVATKLNLSDKTLRRWEEAGRFCSSRTLGNQRRYSIDDLQVLDAIKHGVVNEQKDLLTLVQASNLCGVSPTSIIRWENDGKIHPLITSGNTYYPRQKLVEKMEDLKTTNLEPVPSVANLASESVRNFAIPDKKLSPLPVPVPNIPGMSGPTISPILTNMLITFILLISYHLLFNQKPSAPISPSNNVGSVQGVATTTLDPRVDDLLTKFQEHLSSEMLKDAKPIPVTTINLDSTALIYGTSILSKGKNQISVTQDKVTPSTPITVTFTNDYAPAKKYWVTTDQGSFTLHTDFPVSSDSTFNYNLLALPSSPSATPTITPGAILR